MSNIIRQFPQFSNRSTDQRLIYLFCIAILFAIPLSTTSQLGLLRFTVGPAAFFQATNALTGFAVSVLPAGIATYPDPPDNFSAVPSLSFDPNSSSNLTATEGAGSDPYEEPLLPPIPSNRTNVSVPSNLTNSSIPSNLTNVSAPSSQTEPSISLSLSSASAEPGETLTLTALCSADEPEGILVSFLIGNSLIAEVLTDPSGTAIFDYSIPLALAPDNYSVSAVALNASDSKGLEILPIERALSTVQSNAVIGSPVTWTTTVQASPGVQVDESLYAPADASNIRKALLPSPMGAGSSLNSYSIEYETPAPVAIEQRPSQVNATWSRQVTILSSASVHYSDVTAFTDVPNASSVRLFHIMNGSKIDVSDSPDYSLVLHDIDSDGFYDRVLWNIPHLSEQLFEIEAQITVLTLQSYPSVGRNWTVDFQTFGSSDLLIEALQPVEVSLKELYYSDTPNGPWTPLAIAPGASLTVPWDHNYGRLVSKVLFPGKHTIRFTFGAETGEAFNEAGEHSGNFILFAYSPFYPITDANRRILFDGSESATNFTYRFPENGNYSLYLVLPNLANVSENATFQVKSNFIGLDLPGFLDQPKFVELVNLTDDAAMELVLASRYNKSGFDIYRSINLIDSDFVSSDVRIKKLKVIIIWFDTKSISLFNFFKVNYVSGNSFKKCRSVRKILFF